MGSKQRTESKILARINWGVIGALSVDLILLIVFMFMRKSIWELPSFYLFSAILLMVSVIYYIAVSRLRIIDNFKKWLLFALTVVCFGVLVIPSAIAIVLVLGTV